jgi:hypothetical protein
VDVHEYSSGKTVTKAFIANDWKFYDKKGKVVDASCPTSVLVKVKATFWIQKNSQNEQLVTIISNDKHPDICPVRAAQRIVEQAKWLGQSKSEPLAVFLNHHGLKKYLTGNKIAKILQTVARPVHPDLSKDKISPFSLHSGRVWALVLLDEADMPPKLVHFRLCWLGEPYRLCLRDTLVIQSNHLNALNKASNKVMRLLWNNCTILPDEVPLDDEMGEYASEK